jgi:hypothetical protein
LDYSFILLVNIYFKLRNKLKMKKYLVLPHKPANFMYFTLVLDVLLIIKKLVYMADNKLKKK